MILTFLRSLFIGLAIAAPVGPIGVLCIRRTLANGRLSGLVSGMGAATADAIYGSLAAFGLTFLSAWLVGQRFWLGLLGGIFLVYLGFRTLLQRPSPPAPAHGLASDADVAAISPSPKVGRGGRGVRALSSDYTSTLALTLTNPMTILSFAAIYAGMGIQMGSSFWNAALMVTGVFAGSALWWLFLSTAADLLRVRFLTPNGLLWVNRVSGAIILAFGVAALVSLVPAGLGWIADWWCANGACR